MRKSDNALFNGLLLVPAVFLSGACTQIALADPEEPADVQRDQVSATQTAAAPGTGLRVYNEICVACHSPPGIGGAPALGDANAWSARIDQGMDTLIDHALHGYSGKIGIMPRKGGRLDLSDEEIIAAIEYMLEQVAIDQTAQ